MLPAIGEATMQHTVRANYESEMQAHDLAVKKSDQIRKKRPVEKTDDSSRSEMHLKEDEETTRKNKMEDNGEIVVEEYNENGEIVRITPPGYVMDCQLA
jgi:hypothetical protein